MCEHLRPLPTCATLLPCLMELVHIHLHLVQDQRVPGKRIVQEMTSVVVPDDMSQARMSRPCTTGTQRIALGPQH